MKNSSIREYIIANSCVIYKTKDTYGGLSNMASGYSIIVNNTVFKTSEALYQICKFPKYPDIQKEIVNSKSPMTAKMKTKKHSELVRKDWDKIKVSIMRWCLQLKLCNNFDKFSSLLLITNNKPIVEHSNKDKYWGAKKENDKLVGINALGRLLMELREKIIENDLYPIFVIHPPDVPDFLIYGEPVFSVDYRKEFLEQIKNKLKIET